MSVVKFFPLHLQDLFKETNYDILLIGRESPQLRSHVSKHSRAVIGLMFQFEAIKVNC